MVTPRPFIRPATADRIKALRQRGSATTQELQDPAVVVSFRNRTNVVVKANVQPIRIQVDAPAPQVVGQAVKDAMVTGTARFWTDDIDVVRTGFSFRWDDRLCVVTGPATPERYGTRELHFRVDGERPA